MWTVLFINKKYLTFENFALRVKIYCRCIRNELLKLSVCESVMKCYFELVFYAFLWSRSHPSTRPTLAVSFDILTVYHHHPSGSAKYVTNSVAKSDYNQKASQNKIKSVSKKKTIFITAVLTMTGPLSYETKVYDKLLDTVLMKKLFYV